MAKALERRGYFVVRSAGSHSPADLVAAKPGELLLLQVKCTKAGPYAGFGPTERQELSEAAKKAGGSAYLLYWPPDRKGVRWIHEKEWPV